MKKLLGFILFWIGIGMAVMLFITNGFLAICIILLCLILGYNLFTSCWNCFRTSKKPTTVSSHWLSYSKYRVDYALSTFPERRQEVQTYIFFVPPFTLTLTDFKLDFHILLLLLWEWLTALPKCTLLSQTAHFAMKSTSFYKILCQNLIFCFTHNTTILSNLLIECKKKIQIFWFFFVIRILFSVFFVFLVLFGEFFHKFRNHIQQFCNTILILYIDKTGSSIFDHKYGTWLDLSG